MKYLLLLSLLFCLASSCFKKNDAFPDEVTGDGHIRGRLFLYDTLTKHVSGEPQANKIIRISFSDADDPLNYLFADTTDKDGYFLFTSLDPARSYRVHYEDTIAGHISYHGSRDNVRPTIDTLSVNASLDLDSGSGIIYTIQDAAGAPVKAASVCIFGNPTFFKEASCENSQFSLMTDAYGHCFAFNVAPGKYYTTSYIKANGSMYSANDIPDVSNTIIIRTLNLQRSTQTGFNFRIVDKFQNPIPNARLCFFSSQVLADNADCAGSNFQAVADSTGMARSVDIKPGTYYVRGSLTAGMLGLKGQATVTIAQGQIVDATIVLE